MPRVCRTCGSLVAEAAYCPFCSEPTVEHIPARLSQSVANTFRESFERKKRLDAGVGLGAIAIGFGGFVLVVLLNAFLNVSLAYSVVPFIAVFVTLFTHELLFAIRCPGCGVKLGHFDPNIRYCPFCGVSLDGEIDPKSHEATELSKEEWERRGLEIKKQAIQLSPGMRKGNADIQLPPAKEEKGTREEKKGTA